MRLALTLTAICASMAASPVAHASGDGGQKLRERLPTAVGDRPAPKIEDNATGALTESGDASRPLAAPSSIRLEGAIALSPDYFESIFARYVHRGLSRNELAALAREVTDAYRAQGYFLSRAVIPPQTLSSGVLTVSVEEGRYTAIEFESGGNDDLRAYFDRVLAEVPARRATLEHAVLTIGDLSGVVVESSRSVPVGGSRGDYKLVLRISSKAADGLIYADNRGEGGGDAVQMSAQAALNGVGVTGGRIDVNAFTNPGDPSRSQYGQVSYSAPLGLRGTLVSVAASASNSADGDFGSGRFRSRGTEVSLSLRHPVLRTRAKSMWVNVDLVQSNSDSEIDSFGLRRDELSMVRLGASLDIRDGWGGRNRANAAVTFGRDAFETPSPAHPMARSDDGASFTKFTLSASRTQSLTPEWSLHAALRGQYSAGDLPGDEQISFGGARWGRAFDYGEVEGDTGAAAQLELRYTRDKLDFVDSLQAYAFADVAAVWIQSGKGEPDTLSSAGLGLRAAFGGGYRAGVEAAVPIDRIPDGKTNRNPRMFATVSREF